MNRAFRKWSFSSPCLGGEAWGGTQTKVPKVSIISPLNYSISQKASRAIRIILHAVLCQGLPRSSCEAPELEWNLYF